MFGLFRKKQKPSNGWVKLAPHADILAKPGQKFDVRLRSRGEVYGLIMGSSTTCLTSEGNMVWYCATELYWNTGRNPTDVTHYRLHKPEEISDEVVTRAERENTFRDMLDPRRRVNGVEEPRRQPERVR